MSRKRDKPYNTRHVPYTYPKRRRPHPQLQQQQQQFSPPSPEDRPKPKPIAPPALLIVGLPTGCSVLDLKARFEIYGSISRIKIDPHGVGSICFRTFEAAHAALAASLDHSFGISLDSHRVQVMWSTEMKDNDALDGVEERGRRNSNLSKLLKGETPLSRHGKGKRLSSAIVNPNASISNSAVLDSPPKPRQIVAYDDIL